jgi:hypothetical protein
VPPFGWALSVTMASRSSGVASALLISALSLVTIAGGVPAIAKPPVALRPRRLSCLGTDQGKANPPATTSPKNHRAVAAAKPIKTANTVRMSDMGASGEGRSCDWSGATGAVGCSCLDADLPTGKQGSIKRRSG